MFRNYYFNKDKNILKHDDTAVWDSYNHEFDIT